MRVQLANWQPDLQGLTNGTGTADIKNVYPTGSGFAPVKDAMAISISGLDGQCIGAIAAQDATNTTISFAGDSTKLYKLGDGEYDNVSKSGDYAVSAGERWEFAQFGQRVLAAQIGAKPQYYDMGSSTLFDDLGGTPPQARHIAVVKDFVVLGNTTTSPNQIAWSGFNNSAQWTAGSNQSDTQILQGGGVVQRIVGGDVGYIFQERAITRMSFAGPPTYFQFDLIEQARGLLAPGALVTVGSTTFFRGQDGFYRLDPGSGCTPIGNLKVDNWFSSVLQVNTAPLVTASADPANKLIIFSFVSTDAGDASRPDTLLFYHWPTEQWTYAKLVHEMIYPALSEGITLEGLDAIYPTIEDVPVSLDSGQWSGGIAYLGVFTTNHQLGRFSGATLAALMETADFEGVQGRRSMITNTRPFCDSSAATVAIRSRERFADPMVSTSAAVMESTGSCPILSSGRYHRARLEVPAGEAWTFATGMDIDAIDDGEQ